MKIWYVAEKIFAIVSWVPVSGTPQLKSNENFKRRSLFAGVFISVGSKEK
jgi:hypothetical protein